MADPSPHPFHRPSSRPSSPERRTRPRLTEQIQIIRELWLLREQARVQAAERCFLAELERLLFGRPHSDSHSSTVASPPPPPHTPSSFIHSPAPPAPPLPRFSSTSVHSSDGVSLLADGAVYESHPPPRDATAPVRERPDLINEEVEQLRARQHVTNLSTEFRALLEGNGPTPDYGNLVRSRSFGQLTHQRAVSNALESEFRHQLESLLARRDTRTAQSLRNMYNSPLPDVIPTEPPFDHMHDDHEGFTQPANAHLHSERPSLQSQIEELRQEVSILKNVISASFDLQLDIQRSIRQEVSAALNSSRPVREIETSACTDIGGEQRSRAAAAGMCTVCLEKRVDSLLYGCGHMCTCVMCGRQVIAGGLGCPICRAPVRDVVRAYVVTE